ncbi:MAG: hypothetical protein HY011_32910 [Acidobacteria bacterium]|nr:hypothetical protein [Acidobacteriota bacterium]
MAERFRPIKIEAQVSGQIAMLQVTFKNDYEKPITAFCVAGAGRVTLDFEGINVPPDGQRQIGPGEIYTLDLPLGADPKRESRDVFIRSVVFADNTMAGDKSIGKNILDFREGVRRQVSKASVFLRQNDKLLNTANITDVRNHLMNAKVSVELLLGQEGVGESPYLGAGLQHAKECLLSDLQALIELSERNDSKEFEATLSLFNNRYLKFIR